MTLSDISSVTGPLATVVAALVVVLAAFRTHSAKVWREEAEAQKARAERLETDLNEIKERLTRIEAENKRLIELLTALDPARVRTQRF
ncbi:hypothetical protein [Streptomyces werraensis]|uniref:hypothetical protein n=1 Tax=Streptomyces werraensis TaxID=68284 RepID=UPI0036FE7C05